MSITKTKAGTYQVSVFYPKAVRELMGVAGQTRFREPSRPNKQQSQRSVRSTRKLKKPKRTVMPVLLSLKVRFCSRRSTKMSSCHCI